ncbi:flagellar biosynthesis protein FlhB [Simiduia sp. 21SJ11W-1]|uniref:flagellar biosynthesis protein FlhB n=1 Tax=Simiduia sp. 21SJ11W-1 TaxID=2909669 RepID=UPI0020A0F7AE|nr:flagellar biosynthesis protein FlhB [Simiduia sp. 21SJ11W-1]UTA49499.1 flagellar biosynthesis protein FlhB [Simiduia sp. 21SJ11W-1]
MAEENDSSQEKTEEATPRKLEKAREDGQVARSKELTTTILLITGTLALMASGAFLGRKLMLVFEESMTLERETLFDPVSMLTHMGHAIFEASLGLAPLFLALMVAAFVGPISLGGWLVSTKALAPKLNRMDPIAGLKRMFSIKSVVELLKAVGKVGIILLVAVLMLKALRSQLLGLASEALGPAIIHALWLAAISALVLAASTILIAVVDVPFQIWDHAKKLRMSMQDIKDEYKDTEGKPEVKSRVRQLQREMAERRMMSDVPEADVVITNPTHFSVALKYNPETMETPVMVAKGADNIALKIREIANAHGVEIVEAPALARSIFHTTEIGDTVPAGLYVAVAQVLAYVFQLRSHKQGQGDRPQKPRNVQIPPNLRYD